MRLRTYYPLPVLQTQTAILADDSSLLDSCQDSPDDTHLLYRSSLRAVSQRPEAADTSSVPRQTPFR